MYVSKKLVQDDQDCKVYVIKIGTEKGMSDLGFYRVEQEKCYGETYHLTKVTEKGELIGID